MRRTAVLILVVLALAAPVSGQAPVKAAAMRTDSTDRTQNMVTGGLLGGTLGLFAGGGVGLVVGGSGPGGLAGAAMGALVGESLGIAFGVHTGNDRRGSYGAAVAGPIAVVAGTIALVDVVGDQGVPAIAIGVAVPVAQLYASILGEQAAMRRREGGRE